MSGSSGVGRFSQPVSLPSSLPFQHRLRSLRRQIASRLPASMVSMSRGEEEGPQGGLLKELSGYHFTAERAALRVLVAEEDLVSGAGGLLLLQFDAGAEYGAGHWALSLVGPWHNSLRAEEYGCAARRRFCLTFPGLRGYPACPFLGCTERLDPFGRHIFACGGEHQKGRDQRAHNEVRDHLFGVCKQAGFRPQCEPPGLIDGSRERPADVLLPAGHRLGGAAAASHVCCIDVSGVRSESRSYVPRGLMAPLAARHAKKAQRPAFPEPPEEVHAAVRAATAAAFSAARAGGASEEAAARARDAAMARELAARAPALYLEPVVFSSMGCFYDGAKGRGLRAVLAALAAGYRRAESDRADGAGSETARSRWLPRLSAALERGVWWRVQYTLRALEWRAAPEEDVHMVLSDLSCYSAARVFAAPPS